MVIYLPSQFICVFNTLGRECPIFSWTSYPTNACVFGHNFAVIEYYVYFYTGTAEFWFVGDEPGKCTSVVVMVFQKPLGYAHSFHLPN